ncbi:MAG: restriction endonuclease [Acidobacteriaceae bacterium]
MLRDYELTSQDVNGAYRPRWYKKALLITHPDHPKHQSWLSYQDALSKVRSFILQLRQAAEADERQRKLEAEEAVQQAMRQVEPWMKLNGQQFERELALLFKRRGYIVECVGGPGDEGADLIMVTQRGRVIVQCKAHATRIGPGAVRDLFGSLQHHNAVEGWLVATEGFSGAAHRFANGKPIKLLTIRAILENEQLSSGH